MKLGFIGLGIMGAPMAGHLLAGGHEVFAFSRSGVPAAVTAQGAKPCASPAEVAPGTVPRAGRYSHPTHPSQPQAADR